MTEGWPGDTEPMCYHCGKRHVGPCVGGTAWDRLPGEGTTFIGYIPPAEKPKFDRVGYMREYMRGWRKRKKAEKESQK
jgi:hypothetical protein